jgi:hypothetical protein
MKFVAREAAFLRAGADSSSHRLRVWPRGRGRYARTRQPLNASAGPGAPHRSAGPMIGDLEVDIRCASMAPEGRLANGTAANAPATYRRFRVGRACSRCIRRCSRHGPREVVPGMRARIRSKSMKATSVIFVICALANSVTIWRPFLFCRAWFRDSRSERSR